MAFQIGADESARIVDFYKTISGLSFTFLGLWWIVIQARFAEGRGTPQARRHAYGVMLYFLSWGDEPLFDRRRFWAWWRLVFAITGLLGLLEIVMH